MKDPNEIPEPAECPFCGATPDLFNELDDFDEGLDDGTFDEAYRELLTEWNSEVKYYCEWLKEHGGGNNV